MALALLALAWMLGISAAAFTGGDHWATVAASGLFAAAVFAVRPRVTSIVIAALGTAFIFGAAWRYTETVPTDPPLAAFNEGGDVRLRGVVSTEPNTQGASVAYRIDVSERFENGRWQPQSGGFLLRAPIYPQFNYGDLLEVSGSLQTPENFGDFDYRDYLLHRGIGSIMSYPPVRLVEHDHGSRVRAWLIDARGELAGDITAALPEPEACLGPACCWAAAPTFPPACAPT